jgi:hypothetical protein
MARVRIWGSRELPVGYSWMLRVTDHETALLDPKVFSSLVHRQVGGVVEMKVWTADKQPVALLAKK